MLTYHFIDPYLGTEKGDSKIKEHWFWICGLRHLQHISAWDSGKFHAEPEIFFHDKKE